MSYIETYTAAQLDFFYKTLGFDRTEQTRSDLVRRLNNKCELLGIQRMSFWRAGLIDNTIAELCVNSALIGEWLEDKTSSLLIKMIEKGMTLDFALGIAPSNVAKW